MVALVFLASTYQVAWCTPRTFPSTAHLSDVGVAPVCTWQVRPCQSADMYVWVALDHEAGVASSTYGRRRQVAQAALTADTLPQVACIRICLFGFGVVRLFVFILCFTLLWVLITSGSIMSCCLCCCYIACGHGICISPSM